MKAMLNGQVVNASTIDPTTHVYVGMWRSPQMLVDEDSAKHGYVIGPSGISAYCPTCRWSYSAKAPHVHQQQGCWDMPSYRQQRTSGEKP